MKKNLLLLLLAFMTGFHFSTKAADHVVQVIDNEFVPSTLNISVGDRVIWQRQASAAMPHNVTSSWANSPDLLSSNPTFTFTFSQQGTFPYYCSYHGTLTSGMRGSITVSSVTGFKEDKAMSSVMEVYPNPARENVMVKLDNFSSKTYHFTLTNMIGQTVSVVADSDLSAGSEAGVKLDVRHLPAGVYYLRLLANDKIMDTRRLLLKK